MPPQKGGNNKWAKKRSAVNETAQQAPLAEDGQQYAVASKMLGNKRLLVKGIDGKERLAIIPGKFKGRRNWIAPGMLLLIGIREYQDDKVDVIYIYSPQDAKRLQRKGELGDLLGETIEDDTFVFGVEGDLPVEDAPEPAKVRVELPLPDSDEIDLDDL